MTDTPAYHEWTERLLPPHLATLDPVRIEIALDRGAVLDPDSVIPQLLAEIIQLDWEQHLQSVL